jgi:hypothetical protein
MPMKLLLSAVMFSIISSFVFADHHDSAATTADEQRAASTQIDSFKAISVSGEVSVCDASDRCERYFDIKGDLFFSELGYSFLGEGRYSHSQFTRPIRVKYENGDNVLKLQIGKSKWTFMNLARSDYADHEYDIPLKTVRFFVEKDKFQDGNNVTRLVAGSYLILHP